jgi:hypothetical protein
LNLTLLNSNGLNVTLFKGAIFLFTIQLGFGIRNLVNLSKFDVADKFYSNHLLNFTLIFLQLIILFINLLLPNDELCLSITLSHSDLSEDRDLWLVSCSFFSSIFFRLTKLQSLKDKLKLELLVFFKLISLFAWLKLANHLNISLF